MTQATLTLLLLAQTYPPPFPREGATKLIENDRVVVWEVVWQKGKPTPMHQHPLDVAGVFLADGAVKIRTPDGQVRLREHSPIGEVTFSAKGVTHSEEGVSDSPRRGIIIELKDTKVSAIAGPPGVPLAFPREGAKSLLDNPRLSVWDYQWVRGKPVPLHFHDKDVVVVFIEPGGLRSFPQGGEPTVSARKFGEVSFNPRNRTHSEESIEGTPRGIIIELK